MPILVYANSEASHPGALNYGSIADHMCKVKVDKKGHESTAKDELL
jgi:hypothetical protein